MWCPCNVGKRKSKQIHYRLPGETGMILVEHSRMFTPSKIIKGWVSLQQCCVTRVGTRTRVQFFSLWLGLGLRNRDSCPSPSSSGHAVLRCLLWHSIHFVVCLHVLEDNKCWICGLLDLWLRLKFFFDSDSEVMTRTRTQRWWLGLGFDNLDSDTALVFSV